MIDNPRIASDVLRHCAGEGVLEYCLAAGARNAPLALALLEGAGNPQKIYHFFDERAAGFFALGRCLASRRPVAVVTTSGTAVAELLPAVVEAHYQAAPLIAVTADRPVSFRGSGAPQAIEQVGIFGDYAATVDVNDRCAFPLFSDRPIHLNVPFGEPKREGIATDVPDECERSESTRYRPKLDDSGKGVVEEFVSQGGIAVIVGSLHPEETDHVDRFLRRLGAPVYAEPASNLRGCLKNSGVERFEHESEWVALVGRAERILRIGGVPVGRWWRDLENTEHEILNLSPSGHPGVSRSCVSVRVGDFSALDEVVLSESANGGEWVSKGGGGGDLAELLSEFPGSEPSLIRAISKMIPSGDAVFLGNSLPIREWDLAAVPPEPGTAFFANRGANGIDGALSTALGNGANYSGIWAVVGDLTALYDLSAPWVIPQLAGSPKIRIVVINNGGGKIFSHLPALAHAGEQADAMIQNRHQMGFRHWASMWGLQYRRVGNSAELAGYCDSGLPDQAVIEIVPDEKETSAFWHRYRG